MTEPQKHVLFGIRQMNAGNPRGAIKHLRDAIAADADNVLAHANLAICLAEIGQNALAEEASAAALRLAPEDFNVQFAAGVVELRNDRHTPAERHFLDALKQAPWDTRIHQQLAYLLETTQRRKRAIQVLREGLERVPNDVGLITVLGQLLFFNGQLLQAEECAIQALKLNPESADAHALMGYVRLQNGNLKEARQHARMALRCGPTNPESHRLAAFITIRDNPLNGLWWRIQVASIRIGAKPAWVIMMLMYAALLLFGYWLDEGHGLFWTAVFAALWFGLVGYLVYMKKSFDRLVSREKNETPLKSDF